MPAACLNRHDDLLRRLDELPISEHDRRVAKAQATLAFGLVDTIADAMDDLRALFAPSRAALTLRERE